jgi:DNA adenine methylase
MPEGVAAVAEAPVARPPLKIAGGKRQLLPALREHFPKTFRTYYEPFFGGGAVFFDLHARGLIKQPAKLGDSNKFFVNVYLTLQEEPDKLIELLRGLEDTYKKSSEKLRAELYYGIRASLSSQKSVRQAAHVVFLNKIGFNGLWRVNKSGTFNVPFGHYPNPTICDEENLRACAGVLREADVKWGDFEETVWDVGHGDFAYFDCPYVPVSATGNFTAYTQDGFSIIDQERLRDVALRLKRRGAHVVLSNADVPIVRELYSGRFKLHEVQAKRAINSNASKRGSVGELIIT